MINFLIFRYDSLSTHPPTILFLITLTAVSWITGCGWGGWVIVGTLQADTQRRPQEISCDLTPLRWALVTTFSCPKMKYSRDVKGESRSGNYVAWRGVVVASAEVWRVASTVSIRRDSQRCPIIHFDLLPVWHR